MNTSKSLFILLLFVFGTACELQDEPSIRADQDYSFYITGIKESVSYTFHSGNERIAATPDDVKSLTIIILDENGELAHERRYNQWYEGGVIPDSIYIPALPAGNYTIYALTLDYYNYWYYNDNPQPYPEDSLKIYGDFTIEPYTVSESPIYVGSVEFLLEEEEQNVVLEMKNISSKISITSTNTVNGWLDIGIETKDSKYYDMKTGTFMNADYGSYIYMYMGDNATEKSFYILPQTLKKLEINFYDYSNYTVSPKILLDPFVSMNVGDAITFKMDVDALLKGSGSGTIEWENITWNNLGEVNIP